MSQETFAQDDSPTQSSESLTQEQMFDLDFSLTNDSKEETEIFPFLYSNELREIDGNRKILLFTKKMNARRRLGYANVIKRAICRKGLYRRSTTALRLLKITNIFEKLKRKRSIYF
jgi:hypothetical protein